MTENQKQDIFESVGGIIDPKVAMDNYKFLITHWGCNSYESAKYEGMFRQLKETETFKELEETYHNTLKKIYKEKKKIAKDNNLLFTNIDELLDTYKIKENDYKTIESNINGPRFKPIDFSYPADKRYIYTGDIRPDLLLVEGKTFAYDCECCGVVYGSPRHYETVEEGQIRQTKKGKLRREANNKVVEEYDCYICLETVAVDYKGKPKREVSKEILKQKFEELFNAPYEHEEERIGGNTPLWMTRRKYRAI